MRSIGPEMDTAATTRPEGLRTGADTEATPSSRSPTLCAHPRRRTPESVVAVNFAPCSPRWSRSGSSQASSTWAAEPASIDRLAPTGMESRRPTGRSAAATQMRWSPWRRNSCALSFVWSRRAPRTGPAAARSRSSPAADASSPSRGARQTGGADELCERGRAGLEGAQHRGRLVEDADPRRVVHALILTSQALRRQSMTRTKGRGFQDSDVASRSSVAHALEQANAARRDEMGGTLAEKVWDAHVVRRAEGEPDLLYIDLHLLHEVTSPQAFDGLRLAGRQVRRPDLTLATEDHNVPTVDWDKPIADPVSKTQVDTLRKNCEEFGVRLHALGDIEQGIVHIIGPQLGLTQPGMTIVCGDSHTSTHGAF